jgi:AraC-like DNA-binding protein
MPWGQVMNMILLTVTQAVALAGLIPCLFVMVYLVMPLRKSMANALPIAYFLALGANFLYYLLGTAEQTNLIVCLVAEAFPALSYLLLIQFLLGRTPNWPHFLMLPGSLIGAFPFLYALRHYKELCLTDDVCLESEQIFMLYSAAIFSFVFLLLTVFLARYRTQGEGITGKDRDAKYWLIVSVVFVNICLLGLSLLRVAGFIRPDSYDFSRIVLQIAFIYLIISSIFRVFTKSFAIQPLPYPLHSGKEKELVGRLTELLEVRKLYTDPECNRALIARELGINENYASQLINRHYKRSITELLNDHRVEEAKRLLKETEEPITEVAFSAGFNSLPSFNRIFKEATSLSPRDFRKNSVA